MGQQKLAVNEICENIFKFVELFLSINGILYGTSRSSISVIGCCHIDLPVKPGFVHI